MERKVLVTGATGLLGRQVLARFREQGWAVRGLGFFRLGPDCQQCDLLDMAATAAQFSDFQPAVVVHCAAERRPDKLEVGRLRDEDQRRSRGQRGRVEQEARGLPHLPLDELRLRRHAGALRGGRADEPPEHVWPRPSRDFIIRKQRFH